MNDPALISLVNKLQDVFATVGVCPAFTFPILPRDYAFEIGQALWRFIRSPILLLPISGLIEK